MLNKKGADLWSSALSAVQEAKGLNPIVLDLVGHCSWTDYMIIVTATSRVHLRGIYQKVLDLLKADEHLFIRNSKGTKDENQWILMDCGSLVIQIMTAEAREYYDLEGIWFESELIFKEEDYSSISSSSN
ncbi:ribosome silencing factor [Oceanispirochaeta sp.]|uniref:ribosome silencing factor n=1 Tax=Oceanispirochaeta sp. TaxID=2035350 RepID=UPI002612C10B|nr:ribosome silencing factor [Oceanispirochaeta sp.]MDA3955330.1 ribosome silencing factor [Oceanispirochaeta sp.]